MQAREIMTESPACCTPSDSLRTVANAFIDNDCGLLPVVDSPQNKRLIGVVSDRDIVCRVLAKDDADWSSATVQQAMTTGKLWTVQADASVDEVLEKMEEGQVRRIPVVDEKNSVVGIIATADIALELDEPEEVAEVFEEISEPTHIPHA